MKELKSLRGINSPLSYRKPRYDPTDRVIPWPLPDHPTCDTYRVRASSEEYTCDNEGP
jgi:hypothetical protein